MRATNLLWLAMAVGGFAACSDDEVMPSVAEDASVFVDAEGVDADASLAETDASLGETDASLGETDAEVSVDDTSVLEAPTDVADATDVIDASELADASEVDTIDAPPAKVPIDFHVPGTAVGDVASSALLPSSGCLGCHGSDTDADMPHAPYPTWRTSLMAWGGRDPLFFAQMTTANQDVPGVGYYCLRCHVPMTIPSGHALDWKGATLDDYDRDGVNCHFCHAMVDPIFVKGKNPAKDEGILAKLADAPKHYGNAQFVLDPDGTRRGPYDLSLAYHPTLQSPFVRSGDMCGTCHDVGNLAVSKQPDGSYAYNTMGAAAPDPDPRAQFPLERTYTEWKLSTFAAKGVDMKGRFGGVGATVVSTCQDCHMPRAKGRGCQWGPERDDLARHDFAGASAWVLRAIATENPSSAAILEKGAVAAETMVSRAATLELTQTAATLHVKLVNETGHKLPTGHIEGRRVWLDVQVLDASSAILVEYGKYDLATATLDEKTTTVFEMHVGLSAKASTATGLPPGLTTHMALADSIVKDNRIPPRGFVNATYAAAGAPVVGATYADGQHWAIVDYTLPAGSKRVKVTAYYQTAPRAYIEHLREANKTDTWGERLHTAWTKTSKGPPVPIASAELAITP